MEIPVGCKSARRFWHDTAVSVIFLLALMSSAFAQSVTVPIIEHGDHQGNAIDLLRQGKLEQATHEAELGLDTAKKDRQQQSVASAYSVMGEIYRRQNRYQDSLKCYQQSLDYWKTELGQGFNEAMILNNMAEEYRAINQLDKALPLLLEARSKIGPTEINYWAIMENLGNTYYKLGKLSEAEASWKKAVETVRNHSDYRSEIDSLCGLAIIYSKQGRKAELNSTAKQAISLTEAYVGASDPRIAFLKKLQSSSQPRQSADSQQDDTAWKSQTMVAMQALKTGNFSFAEKPLQAALKEAEGFGGEDPRLAISLSNLGIMYYKLGKFQQAEQYLQRGLPIARKALGAQSMQVASILDSLVPTYIKQGKFEQAEPLLKEFISIQEKTPRYTSQDRATAQGMYKNLQAAIERRKKQEKNRKTNGATLFWRPLFLA